MMLRRSFGYPWSGSLRMTSNSKAALLIFVEGCGLVSRLRRSGQTNFYIWVTQGLRAMG